MITKYNKTLVLVVMAVLTIVQSAVSDGHISAAEWIAIMIALAMALNTYVVPNLTTFPYAKTIVNATLAALNLVQQLFLASGHALTASQWINVGLLVLGTLIGLVIPNTGGSLHVAVTKDGVPQLTNTIGASLAVGPGGTAPGVVGGVPPEAPTPPKGQ